MENTVTISIEEFDRLRKIDSDAKTIKILRAQIKNMSKRDPLPSKTLVYESPAMGYFYDRDRRISSHNCERWMGQSEIAGQARTSHVPTNEIVRKILKENEGLRGELYSTDKKLREYEEREKEIKKELNVLKDMVAEMSSGWIYKLFGSKK